MNKLQGFYELQDAGLPCVDWREFKEDTVLDSGALWTIRSAVMRGDDQNLPRRIGVRADEAEQFARGLLKTISGMVIYYPYFVADKSGTLEIRGDSVIIECVAGDLWHMVSEGERAVTYIAGNDGRLDAAGDKDFLSLPEMTRVMTYVPRIRGRMREQLAGGGNVLLEWSFARRCNENGEPFGESEFVFYELRTV